LKKIKPKSHHIKKSNFSKLDEISPLRKTIKFTKKDKETISEQFFHPGEIECGSGITVK
jgi:hypothetical protein